MRRVFSDCQALSAWHIVPSASHVASSVSHSFSLAADCSVSGAFCRWQRLILHCKEGGFCASTTNTNSLFVLFLNERTASKDRSREHREARVPVHLTGVASRDTERDGGREMMRVCVTHDHKFYEVSNAITRLLRHDQSVPRGRDGAIHCSDIIEECRKKKFDDASQWPLEAWISWQKEEELRKNQYCFESKLFQSIQGHSGDNAVDPALQDNVLLPKGFTEYIYHVGNANELNSIIRNGLIPGGKSFKRGRPAVFCTEDVYGMEETPRDLTKPRIAPYKNTWKRLQHTVFWCKFKLAQEKGLLFPKKRECKRLHVEHLARTQEEYITIVRSQQIRQRRGQQLVGNEEYDYAVDSKTGWRFYKGSLGNLQTNSSG